jgi:hypothetical protein
MQAAHLIPILASATGSGDVRRQAVRIGRTLLYVLAVAVALAATLGGALSFWMFARNVRAERLNADRPAA